jgi:hypothetical protein
MLMPELSLIVNCSPAQYGLYSRCKKQWYGTAGHHNVMYVGDRVKRGQLNGKSANLNHTILTKIYPSIESVSEVPEDDIIMIMDCDHMVKPEIFLKMGSCMLDPDVGVTLIPQVRTILHTQVICPAACSPSGTALSEFASFICHSVPGSGVSDTLAVCCAECPCVAPVTPMAGWHAMPSMVEI